MPNALRVTLLCRTIEQRNAQLFFQIFDVAGECGLRDEQLLGGFHVVAGIGKNDEFTDIVEVHADASLLELAWRRKRQLLHVLHK